MKFIQREKGFTLLEILLVLIIASAIMVMFINFTGQQANQQRRDITSLRMQQVLNAALAFYNQNGRWPSLTATPTQSGLQSLTTAHELIGSNYLSRMGTTGTWVSSYGTTMVAGFDSSRNIFYVAASLPALTTSPSNAQIIAGILPSGINVSSASAPALPPTPSACTSGQVCYVMASVPPPGQNLNNARSVNFASVYHSSACVPAPMCPKGMTPQIFVVPVSVSGINDPPTCTSNDPSTCTNVNVYPISSYTGYAVARTSGAADTGPMALTGTTSNPVPYYLTSTTDNIPGCGNSGVVLSEQCYSTVGDSSTTLTALTSSQVPGYYWRVCLTIVTDRGIVQPAAVSGYPSPWGRLSGTVMAITRCAPSTEEAGSDFTVFSPSGN